MDSYQVNQSEHPLFNEDLSENFLKKKQPIYNFGIELGENDKIITLSTCTDDNKGRKVIHAKMVE